jgi:siroheme synthase-like protein
VSDPDLYPVLLRLDGRDCLVVGGGRVATRKVEGLLGAGAAVTVVAPELDPALSQLVERGVVSGHRRPYESGEAAGYRLVITATGVVDVDAQVFADAEAAGVWVNAADDPEHCTAVLPAVSRQGPIVAAFSTSGRSPALATWLRRRYDAELGPEHLVLLDLLVERRRQLQADGRPTEGLDWQRALDSGMLDLVREGNLAEAKEHLEACLSSSSG